ncbi:lipid droplet assembly factor 1-like [Stigmatopora nigra]
MCGVCMLSLGFLRVVKFPPTPLKTSKEVRVKMQAGSSNEMWEGWNAISNQVYNNPKVTALMTSRAVQYLNGHPVLALAVMTFCATAVVPVSLFVFFAVVTLVMGVGAFLLFEGFLLFMGTLSLLCILSGVAFFSLVASAFVAAFYMVTSNVLNYYYPHLNKVAKEHEKSDMDEMTQNTIQ